MLKWCFFNSLQDIIGEPGWWSQPHSASLSGRDKRWICSRAGSKKTSTEWATLTITKSAHPYYNNIMWNSKILSEISTICIDESEADATLTADDNSERADSADFTPHGKHYQLSIDLTRFQKLIESEEESDPSTREEAHRHDIPQCSHITRSHKSTEMQPRSGQREEQHDDNSSVDGMSELSSIPPESGGRENITVDSEASSVHAHPIENITKEPVHGRSGASDRQPLVAGREDDFREGEGERGKKRHQTVTSSSLLTQHPLHVAHRMAAAPSAHQKSSQEPEMERDSERGHQDKIHSQLHTPKKVDILPRSWIFRY